MTTGLLQALAIVQGVECEGCERLTPRTEALWTAHGTFCSPSCYDAWLDRQRRFTRQARCWLAAATEGVA